MTDFFRGFVYAGRGIAAGSRGRNFRVMLVAAPRVLGDLRKALNAQATAKIGGEIGKDLTQVAVHDLGPHLSDLVTL